MTSEQLKHHPPSEQGKTPRMDAVDTRLGRLERAWLAKRGIAPPPVDLIAQPGPTLPPGVSVVDALLEERRAGR